MISVHNFPGEYRSAYEADVLQRANFIKSKLQASLEAKDYGEGVCVYIQELTVFLSEKNTLSPELKGEFALLVLKAIQGSRSSGEVTLQRENKYLEQLYRCIKKGSKLEEPARTPDITLSWRFFYDLLLTEHVQPRTEASLIGAVPRAAHQKILKKVIRKARRYFAPSATQEILDELWPSVCPFDNAWYRSTGLLSLFLPHLPAQGCVTWIPRVIEALSWKDRCPESSLAWISLLSRAAKHTVGVFDWSPYIHTLLNHFMHLLDLQIASRNPVPSNKKWPAEYHFLINDGGSAIGSISICMAKLLIYASTPSSSSQASLVRFLSTLAPYYHPSNAGAWSGPLGNFIWGLTVFYTKRCGVEAREKAVYTKEFYLDHKDISITEAIKSVALHGMYARQMKLANACHCALQQLGYVHPQVVFPKLLSHLQSALTSLTEPARMMSALNTLRLVATSMLSRSNFPQGAQYLSTLLRASLPGLDAMDPMKTIPTLLWLRGVFSCVPFIDNTTVDAKSSVALTAKNSNNLFASADLEQSVARTEVFAKEACGFFGEFSVSFLQRIFAVMQPQSYSSKDHLAMKILGTMDSTVRAFFQTISAPIYARCLAELLTFIQANKYPKAKKYFGCVCAAAGFARPADCLAKVVPLFSKLLISDEKKDGKPTLKDLSKSDLQWYLYLLGQFVKSAGGSSDADGPDYQAVLSHLDTLKSIYELSLASKGKPVQEMARKLLRYILRAMSSVYPSEERPFSKQVWKEDGSWKHWEAWGRFHEVEQDGCTEAKQSLNIEWHVPSSGEAKAVNDIALETLAPFLATIDSAVAGTLKPKEKKVEKEDEDEKEDSSTISVDDQVDEAITGITNVVRGASTMLGALTTSSDTGPGLPRASRARLVSSISTEEGDAKVSLRAKLARVTHALCGKYLTDSAQNTNVKMIISLTTLIKHVMLVEGLSNPAIVTMKKSNKYTRFWHKYYHIASKCVLRPHLVRQAHAQYMTIQKFRIRSQPYASVISDLVDDLRVMSVMDFKEIRSKSLTLLYGINYRWPQAMESIVSTALAVIKSGDSTEEPLKGASSILGHMVDDLSMHSPALMCEVMHTLCRHAQQHVDDPVQVQFSNLFLSYFQRRDYLVVGESKGAEHTARLVFQLTALLSPNATHRLHWRYALMTAAFLAHATAHLLKRQEDVKLPAGLVEAFARGVLSDVLPMRTISIAVLGRILLQHAGVEPKAVKQASDKKAAAAQVNSLLQGGNNDAKIVSYLDTFFSGWNLNGFGGAALLTVPSDASTTTTGCLDAKSLDFLSKYMSDNIATITTHMVTHHPSLQPQNKNSGGGPTGSGDIIAMSVCSAKGEKFPSSTSRLSKALDLTHVSFIQGLVCTFPALWKPIVAQISNLLEHPDKADEQCTAAELFAGVARAALFIASIRAEVQDALYNTILPKMTSLCRPDCKFHWCDAIRYVLWRTDPRRHKALFEVFLDQLRNSSVASPSVQLKLLVFIQPLLMEAGWRGAALAKSVLEIIADGWLHSPYEQVRQEVAIVIAWAVGCLFRPFGDETPQDTTGAFISVLVKNFKESSFVSTNESKSEEKLSAEKKEEQEAFVRTVCHWMKINFQNRDTAKFARIWMEVQGFVLAAISSEQSSQKSFSDTVLATNTLASWAPVSQKNLSIILAKIKAGSLAANWHVRRSSALFLKVSVPRHAFLLGPDEVRVVYKMLARLITDEQLEVREEAYLAMASLVSTTGFVEDPKARRKMIKRFSKLCNTKLAPLTDAKSHRESLSKKHGGVLGLSALIVSFPYTLPDWMPDVLAFLALQAQAPHPIGGPLRKLYAAFKRSHKDEWPIFKEQFTQEQLDIINEVNFTASYFA